MLPKKRVTHQDVAKRAGVSTAVVSYVVNNGPRQTSAEVRERVLAAIRELDYHPNAFARGLRARRTNTIGFIVNDYNPLDVFESPYSAGIMTGLTAQLKLHAYYVLVYPLAIGEDTGAVEQLVRSGRLDGVVVRLVQDPPETDALLELIAATRVPCVCIERPGDARFGFGAVTYDDSRGAHAATSYLISQGHRRIGHLAGDGRYHSARARKHGYEAALAEHGIAVDPALIYGNDWSLATARAGVAHLLSLADPPTALFAASDSIAIAVLEALRQRAYRVPEQLAVIGFDDIALGSQLAVPLTTVRIPLHTLGQRAAERVLATIRAPDDTQNTSIEEVPVALIQRGTA